MEGFTVLILPEVKDLVVRKETAELREMLRHLHPADVADVLVNLDGETGGAVFDAMEPGQGVKTFEHVPEGDQTRLMDVIGQAKVARVIEGMSSDDRAHFLKSLPQATIDAILPLLAQAERNDVVRLMAFDEGTAGSIMTTEYVHFVEEMTVAEALAQIRKVAPLRETVYYVYVTDTQHHLFGVLSLRQLILAKPEQKVGDIAQRNVIRVIVDADQEQVAQTFEKYDFLAVPVTDNENRLLGIVTHDDVLDVVVAEATEDAHRMGAVGPMVENHLTAPFARVWRKRVGWLSCLFLAELFTFTALSHFEKAISQVVVLALFVPLCISTGGNSGSQAATLITRALALGHVTLKDWRKVLRHEILMGFALGLTLGAIGFVRACMTPASILGGASRLGLGLVISQSVTVICLWGTLIGSLLPLLFKRLGFDPGMASSPFVATFVDVTGIMIYFSIARVYLL